MSLSAHESAAYWRIVSKLRDEDPRFDAESRVPSGRTHPVRRLVRQALAALVLTAAVTVMLVGGGFFVFAVAMTVALVASYALFAPLGPVVGYVVAWVRGRIGA